DLDVDLAGGAHRDRTGRIREVDLEVDGAGHRIGGRRAPGDGGREVPVRGVDVDGDLGAGGDHVEVRLRRVGGHADGGAIDDGHDGVPRAHEGPRIGRPQRDLPGER